MARMAFAAAVLAPRANCEREHDQTNNGESSFQNMILLPRSAIGLKRFRQGADRRPSSLGRAAVNAVAAFSRKPRIPRQAGG
jgi:hypothetical protein